MTEDLIFQQGVIAWCLQHPGEFAFLADRLKTFHFTDPRAEKIWPILVSEFEKRGTFPTQLESERLLRRKLEKDATLDIHLNYLTVTWQTDTTVYTGDEVKNWLAQREILEMSNEMRDIVSKGLDGQEDHIFKWQERLEAIRLIHTAGTAGDEFRPLDPETVDSIEGIVEDLYGGDPVPTGIYRLDKKIRDGGMRAHLTLIVGPSGTGKTVLATHIVMHNIELGKRAVVIALDDNPGELTERYWGHILRRPVSFREEMLDGTLEQTKKEVRQLLDTKYAGGDLHCQALDPETYTPQDVLRELMKLQRRFYALDRAFSLDPATPEEDRLPPERWGAIDLVVVDTADQIKPHRHYRQEWKEDEKIFQALGLIPKRLGAATILTVQGNQASVGAAQVTLRNVGGSYGKVKPAKLIITFAQTYNQYHALTTVNPALESVRMNLKHMPTYDIEKDRNTEWRRWSCCIIKNTRGRDGAGATDKVMLPMLVNYASCRILEDFSQPETLITVDKVTVREEADADAAQTMHTNHSDKRERRHQSGKRGAKK